MSKYSSAYPDSLQSPVFPPHLPVSAMTDWQYRQRMGSTRSKNDVAEQFETACRNMEQPTKYTNAPGLQSSEGAGLPYRFKSLMDDHRPFGFESSDLKEKYVAKERAKACMVFPVIQF